MLNDEHQFAFAGGLYGVALNNSGGLKGGKRILFCFGRVRLQLVQQALSLYAREQKTAAMYIQVFVPMLLNFRDSPLLSIG